MKNIDKKIIAGVVGVLILILSSGFYFFSNKTGQKTSMKTENFVAGFNDNTHIKISYLAKQNSQSKAITTNGKTPLPAFPAGGIFEINFNIADDKKPYDVLMTKNRDGVTIAFKELPLNSKISVLSDKNQQDIPVDWSGNLTLFQTSGAQQICIKIAPNNNRVREICYGLESAVAS